MCFVVLCFCVLIVEKAEKTRGFYFFTYKAKVKARAVKFDRNIEKDSFLSGHIMYLRYSTRCG